MIFLRFAAYLVGIIYPAICSYKVLHKKEINNYKRWLKYWAVFALFSFVEATLNVFIFDLLFYYEAKLALLIFLLNPFLNGTSILYNSLIHRWVKHHYDKLESFLNQGKIAMYNLPYIPLPKVLTPRPTVSYPADYKQVQVRGRRSRSADGLDVNTTPPRLLAVKPLEPATITPVKSSQPAAITSVKPPEPEAITSIKPSELALITIEAPKPIFAFKSLEEPKITNSAASLSFKPQEKSTDGIVELQKPTFSFKPPAVAQTSTSEFGNRGTSTTTPRAENIDVDMEEDTVASNTAKSFGSFGLSTETLSQFEEEANESESSIFNKISAFEIVIEPITKLSTFGSLGFSLTQTPTKRTRKPVKYDGLKNTFERIKEPIIYESDDEKISPQKNKPWEKKRK